MNCSCESTHPRRRVVLTGGPGAGKTAVLEMVRQSFCHHVRVLPESASVIFGGGFPREDPPESRRAEQRAIYFVERELEALADVHDSALVLCDRGTLDGLAYWPGDLEDFWAAAGSTLEQELARYEAVIHLRTPGARQGYNHQNPLRTETAAVAAKIDKRIQKVWKQHPRRTMVDPTGNFLEKASTALGLLRDLVPECCAGSIVVPATWE